MHQHKGLTCFKYQIQEIYTRLCLLNKQPNQLKWYAVTGMVVIPMHKINLKAVFL